MRAPLASQVALAKSDTRPKCHSQTSWNTQRQHQNVPPMPHSPPSANSKSLADRTTSNPIQRPTHASHRRHATPPPTPMAPPHSAPHKVQPPLRNWDFMARSLSAKEFEISGTPPRVSTKATRTPIRLSWRKCVFQKHSPLDDHAPFEYHAYRH